MKANAVWIIAVAAIVAGMIVTSSGGVSVSEEFGQATAASMREASGTVFDWATPADWIVSGTWTLKCGGPCASAEPGSIKFDMAHTMVMEGGNASHAHSYKDFAATAVATEGDNLMINGMITGSGPVGTAPIKIKLTGVGGAGMFSFELPENQHLMGEISGAIVESDD
ncbi:MAG: hypothetical protein HY365_02770 [Candidatus Aenigmarchaeota archaeon]|nr:hypothetical protein [Candidatus Aenigmarchaeota archaeon]